MRLISSILSFLVHLLVFVFVIYSSVGNKHTDIELDKPVYQVNLVQLPQKDLSSKKEMSLVQKNAKQKASQKKKFNFPAPKKIAQQSAKDSRPKPVKIAQKHTSKANPLKAQKKKKPPFKKKRKKQTLQQPSKEKLLAQALTELKNSSIKKEKTNKDILDKELARLEQIVDQSKNAVSGSKQNTRFTVGQIYGRIVEQKVKTNWRYPQMSVRNNLKAEVKLIIDNQGNITKMTLVRKSGRADFDSSVLQAVEKTDTLPPPPTKELNTIRITFNLQDK